MKTLVITGMSRGIGLETARIFLNKGWLVFGTSTQGASPLKHKYLKMYPLDLTNPQQINDFVNVLPRIDLLINNAAVLLEDWDNANIDMMQLRQTFAVNVFGAIELTEHCIPKLNDKAQIINLSSGWGSFSSNDTAYQAHYKMSKVCLNMYTKLLAERLPGITVSSFDPGWVKTDMGTEHAPKLPSEAAQELYTLVNTPKASGCFWQKGRVRAW